MLMHSPHHCSSKILWICCIMTAYHTPASSLLICAILQIGTAIIRMPAYVPYEVHYPLIQRNFIVHCNMTIPWILIPTSTIWTFLCPTLLWLPFFTKLCIEFFSEDTVDLDMKGIGNRHIPSRDSSNSHFPPSFSCASDFLASSDTYFLQKHQSHSILGPVCLYVEPSRGVWSW